MHPDGIPLPQRRWAILAVTTGIVLAVLDATIVNVALPTIAQDVGASPAASVLIVNAYQLALVVFLLPLSAIGEIFGYRRVHLVGVALFTVASLGCALAGTLPELTLARAIQGIGGAGMLAMNPALTRLTYPADRLGRGLALNAAVVAASTAFGPTVCSAVLAVTSWHWIFAVNVPIGIFVFMAGLRSLPQGTPSRRPFDLLGAGLNAAAFGGLILGMEGFTHGQPPALASLLVGVGLIAGTITYLRARRQEAPLTPVDLMRIPIIRLSIFTSASAFCAYSIAAIILPFTLQYGFGRSAEATGLLMTPWPLAMVAIAPVAGRLADRFSAGVLGGLGLGIFAFGLALLAFLPPAPSAFDLAWRLLICGGGFGLFQSPNNRAMLTSAPPHRAGAMGGLLATGRLFGFTTGAVIAAVLLQAAPADQPSPIPMLAAASLALAAALVSLVRTGKPVGREAFR